MATLEEAQELVEEAFSDVPRPTNDELLHPDCFDDMDIEALYNVRNWRETPDAIIEHEYAALYFLSPAGFRHFLTAYLRWVLLHPDSPAAAVDSTVFALTPQEGGLREFSLSKFAEFDAAERNAVAVALETLSSETGLDLETPLAYSKS